MIGEANDRTTKSNSNYVWSLKDINFSVNEGDTLGIIGRNGAGKSTLLKILSKVTGPTTGKIKVKGRVASLLEVGTGFHPELTGKENIFLNGAILGMKKEEINRKFDEIVDFSGVERYIDTPVKRYSSGMYVRLAFAVAAHLESEILIVDEVLAVGDADFQKKCLGKMGDVAKGQGRTVLFVSHNMAAVKSLCNKSILLEHGQLKLSGDTDTCVSYYLKGNNTTLTNTKKFTDLRSDVFNLTEISIKNLGKFETSYLHENEEIEICTHMEFFTHQPERYHITYHLYNEVGEPIFSFASSGKVNIKTGKNKLCAYFPKYFFQSGTFYLSLFIIEDSRNALFIEKDIFAFTVLEAPRELGIYMGREPGYIRPQINWLS
jgi:lipopolysaccharide transport system ATP-binding protein